MLTNRRTFIGAFLWLVPLVASGQDIPATPITTATVHAVNRQPVPLIFDTDMMGDVDDVGTAAVLHALADQGEARILAMGVCVENPWSPLCLDALNTYFRRPDTPLGVVKGPAHNRASKYAQGIAEEFPHALKSAEDAPDAALVYRQVLAKQPDRSVVMRERRTVDEHPKPTEDGTG